MAKSYSELLQAIKAILADNQTIGTQQGLCEALNSKGFIVTQSTLSRLLRKIGVIKVTNQYDQLVYSLPSQTAQHPSAIHNLATLVIEVTHNECMIVIRTNPGSASLVASILDHYKPANILGTVAGDDTIFVIPPSMKTILHAVEMIKNLIFSGGETTPSSLTYPNHRR